VDDAADDLAFNDHRIDHVSAIVHHHIAQDFHVAGLDIDLDLGHMGAIGIGRLIR